jgi:aldehyde:ferredoxin oxidoreductase
MRNFFYSLGRETLLHEADFNRAAGFSEDDDELPDFFYEEALSPSNQVARFHSAEVNAALRRWWQSHAA